MSSECVRLQAATKPPQSLERMLYVAAFAVSSYSGTNNRFLKPFNPLLGETFEFEYPEQSWRGLAEKVSSEWHCIIILFTHPPSFLFGRVCHLAGFFSSMLHLVQM